MSTVCQHVTYIIPNSVNLLIILMRTLTQRAQRCTLLEPVRFSRHPELHPVAHRLKTKWVKDEITEVDQRCIPNGDVP